MDWEQIALFAILGLGAGSLVAGVALGIVVSYRGSGIINLATGAVAMVAGYSYWSLKTGSYGIASSLGFDTTDPAVAPFVKGLTLVGQPKLAADAWVIVAWGQILTTVKLMNKIGLKHLTAAKFTSAIRAFRGPQALGAPILRNPPCH